MKQKEYVIQTTCASDLLSEVRVFANYGWRPVGDTKIEVNPSNPSGRRIFSQRIVLDK